MKYLSELGQRIHIIGVCGSGKTTIAKEIAQRRAVPHIELDSLNWEADWVMADPEVFRQRVQKALARDSWICDGNYGRVRDIVSFRADTIIWLDYSLLLIMYRLLIRTVRRIWTREKVCNNNQETFQAQFLSKDSLFIWALKTYFRRRIEYSKLLAHPEYKHLHLLHFKHPHETELWLRHL